MAVDPVTVKQLTQVEVKLTTDEDARHRTMILAFVPAIGLCLLIALILYLVTSPFSALAGWPVGDEVKAV